MSTGKYDDATTIAAIADPGRRAILDLLRAEDGRPVKHLEGALPHLGRHAVLKHVGVLERAGLVVTRKVGRNRLCYLNPTPLLDLARQWTTTYTAHWGSGLIRLRDRIETDTSASTTEGTRMTTNRTTTPDLVQQIVINAPIERVWEAITTDDARNWYFGCSMTNVDADSDYACQTPDGVALIKGRNVTVDAPRRLVQTFDAVWDEGVAADAPSEVTWLLEQEGPLTTLTIEHRGIAGTETGRQATGGWLFLTSSLKTYVETGTALPQEMG
ncbi:hypothetical protein ASG90_14285 [Nocardioides sp. Soil797]|nr:hypothetical protein ASG90_14285 [Nocardioides sp. Soil797]